MSFKISDNLIGFNKELSFFLKLYKQKKMPNTILFQGLQGIGKYTFILNLIIFDYKIFFLKIIFLSKI